MKLNLLINQKHLAKDGYLNIDPTALPEEAPLIVEGNPTILEKHVEDGEAEEIIAINVIDYVAHTKVFDVLKQWAGKLGHKGKLTVGFTDIFSVSRRFYIGQIDKKEIANILYGKCLEGWDVKKACLSIDDMKQKFLECGLTIKNIKFLEHFIVIEGERP